MPRLVTGLLVIALAGAAAPCAAQETADSTLAAACAGGGTVADGLLLVVFRPDLAPAERTAVARGAGLTLAGPAGSSTGAYYLRVPEGAGSAAAADRVIGFAGVESVGAAACPPPPSPPAAPADTVPGAPAPVPGDSAPPPPAAADSAARPAAPPADTATP